MIVSEPRKAHRQRKREMKTRQVLGLQSGENPTTFDHADAMRKHLFSLLNAPDVAERGLPGCVTTEYKRCGKPRCRCNRGQPHGPYHYWYGRMFGLTWKHYLKRAEAPRVLALCRLGRERRLTRRRAGATLRLFRAQWRAVAALLGDEQDDY